MLCYDPNRHGRLGEAAAKTLPRVQTSRASSKSNFAR